MDKIITVQYQIRKDYCNCCGHKLEKPQISQTREFDFSKGDCLEWLSEDNWKVEVNYEDEFNEIIREFIYETISFFATSSDTKILIENSEFEKVKKFILEEITA
jgi:hypothetical protein